VSDFLRYYEHGLFLAEGKGYITGGLPTAYFPIGYPAFLSLLFLGFGASVMAAQVANACLSVLTVIILYVLAKKCGATELGARMAAVLLALFPGDIAYSGLLSDAVFHQFLMYLGILLLARNSLASDSLAGAVFGLATLTRPYTFLIPAIVAFSLKRTGRPLRRLGGVALLYGVVILMILPWTLRNQRVLEELVPVSTNGGVNLLIGNGPGANGRYNTAPLRALDGEDLTEVERDRMAARLAVQSIYQKPFAFLLRAPLKLLYGFADGAQGLRWNLKGRADRDPGYGVPHLLGMGLFELYYCLLWLGSIAFCIRKWKSGGTDSWALSKIGLSLVLYLTVVTVVFFGNPRYTFPIGPVLCLFAAMFVFGGRLAAEKSTSGQEQA
jgi:hypothetical protein